MATAKKPAITVVTNDGEFRSVINKVKIQSESLAQSIHMAGLYALSYANQHGDVGRANQLVDALGKKHDKKRVQQWLVFFGKIGVKDGVIVYRKRKDILPENLEAWAFRANETPYWELNKQAEMKVTFDYLSLVNSIIRTHDKKVAELTAEGKTVNEVNVGLLDGLKQLIAGYTPAVDVK